MFIQVILFLIGLVLVLKGGNVFVDSSIAITSILRVPRFIIGGTIVSLATTSSEFVVSATASSLGDSGSALGNALGSVIANIGLIVGVTAILTPVSVDLPSFKRRCLWMLIITFFVFIFAADSIINRWGGLFLVFSAMFYLILNIIKANWERQKDTLNTPLEENISISKSILFFIIGLNIYKEFILIPLIFK